MVLHLGVPVLVMRAVYQPGCKYRLVKVERVAFEADRVPFRRLRIGLSGTVGNIYSEKAKSETG